MTNEEILTKAIEKAVKNGYRFSDWTDETLTIEYVKYKDYSMYELICHNKNHPINETELIFSHDFAKAFFPKKEKLNKNIAYQLIPKGKEGWKYHLQEMVILNDEERIKYLEKFL